MQHWADEMEQRNLYIQLMNRRNIHAAEWRIERLLWYDVNGQDDMIRDILDVWERNDDSPFWVKRTDENDD
jgi:hypothetical protein